MSENLNAIWYALVAVLLACVAGGIWALLRGDSHPRTNRKPETLPDLTDPFVINLQAELRRLEAMPIATKADRDKWYDRAAEVQTRLRSVYSSISESLPHELWHYLSDADIRAKEPIYAENQKRALLGLLP